MSNEKEYGVTTNEIMDYLKENMVTREEFHGLERKVDRLDQKVDRLDQKVDGLEQKVDGLEQKVERIEATMATKEDLGKLRSAMIDYLDRRLMDLKADIVLIMRGGDKKLFALAEMLVTNNALSRSDIEKLMKMAPFPQRV